MANEDAFVDFKHRLDRVIAACQQPEERRIGYGNIRHEYCDWCREGVNDTNIAIIYETPGGSTTQINVTFNHLTGEFGYLDEGLEAQATTTNPDEVLRYVENHMRQIPGKRLVQIESTIDSWVSQGKGRSEIFAELNKLLQTEFLGGRVNNNELKHGIQHLVREYARAGA
ncbi:MAG: hypothetical protein KKI08_05545 [Armatimonadetes bacterium]|nr:hypothetical protein [Armatimonadota bacterium]